jgi:tetratricopeptide (TPR) repeat protein
MDGRVDPRDRREMKILLLAIIFGVCVTASAKGLPEFDKLWNYDKPKETETVFRNLIPNAISAKDKDYLLQLRTQIARTEGLQRKFDEAHHTLDGVQKELDSHTSVAEVRYLLERGRVFNSSKKADQALPLFVKAYDFAVARHQDNFAVDAAHMVAIAEPDSAKQNEWNLKALAIAEKSNDKIARDWLGSLYNNMAWTYHDSGKLNEALDLFKKALVFREAKGEPSSIRIAKWSVARTYRSMKKYEEALKIQSELETEFNKLPEKDGYVFEELGELYLGLSKADLSKKYFALAYDELSKDEGLKANEAKRLQRMKELGRK